MSKLTDKIEALVTANLYDGTADFNRKLKAVLADVRELEQNTRWDSALEEIAQQRRAAKREAYEHARQQMYSVLGHVDNDRHMTRENVRTCLHLALEAIDALDTEGE